MKLFLASQFYISGLSIGAKIPDELKKNTVFITTPIKYKVFKEEELSWHYKNRATLEENGFVCKDYDIAGKTESDLKRDLAKYQVMYVEGGNPFYMLQQAQKNNFAQYVEDRIKSGLIYISESAGSVVASADIAANARPGKSAGDYELSSTRGFNLVNFAILPHWGAGNKKKDYFTYKIPQSYNEDFPYVLLPNDQYIEVEDEWYKIVKVNQK
jgi:dipeptidase E